jgi:hypothetical protein
LLPTTDKEHHRKQVSDHLIKLKSQNKIHSRHANQAEYETLQSTQPKLIENDGTITSADKGNSIAILLTQQYNTKIQTLIDKNNFVTSTTNPTNTSQNQIMNPINFSTTLNSQDSEWKFINLNPSAPTINGLIKLHKPA